jgi:hypothetical protein
LVSCHRKELNGYQISRFLAISNPASTDRTQLKEEKVLRQGPARRAAVIDTSVLCGGVFGRLLPLHERAVLD